MRVGQALGVEPALFIEVSLRHAAVVVVDDVFGLSRRCQVGRRGDAHGVTPALFCVVVRLRRSGGELVTLALLFSGLQSV